MYPRFRARHCSRGYISIASPSNTPVAYLYNNSTGRDFLVVRALTVQTLATAFYAYAGSVYGNAGSQGGTINTLVTGETANSGQLFAADLASPPAPDFIIGSENSDQRNEYFTWPIAILQPGWSLFASFPLATAALFEASFLWQRCNAEDIDGSLEDFALKLAGA